MIDVCRLCLDEVQEISRKLSEKCISQKEKIKLLMPEIDMNIPSEFILCNACTHSLNTACEFKTTCIQLEDFIKEYLKTTNSTELVLRDVRKRKLRDIERDICQEDIKTEMKNEEAENFEYIMDIKADTSFSFTCNKCSAVFNCYDEFEKHTHCNQCDQVFYNTQQLEMHTSLHNVLKLFICDLCKRGFKRKYDLKRHRATVHRISETNDINSNKIDDDKDNKDAKIANNDNDEYICEHCTKSFSNREYLRRHIINTHFGTHMCDTCGMKCGSKFTLEEHVRTHTGERPYICKICGKGFSQRGTLNVHVHTHNTTKSHVCDKCGKAFTLHTYLKLHMKTHLTGLEKTFVCTVCNKKYFSRKNLRQHARRHVPIKNHKCSVCFKEFFLPNILKRHMMTHTGEKPFECHTCHKKFNQKYNLQIHFRSHKMKNKSAKQSVQ